MTTISGSSGAGASASLGASRAAQNQQRMFAKTDSNGDGSVDKTELQAMLDKVADKSGTTSLNADDVFSKMDADGSGSLSASELDAGMKGLMPAPSSTVDFAQQRGRADDLFSKIDSDGDGSIDAGELAAMVANGPGGASPSDASDATLTSASTTDSKSSALFAKLDTDADGKLSKAEFDAGKPSGPPPGAGGPPPSSGVDTSGATGATDPLDTNKDGVVSATERAAGDMTALVQDILKAADTDGNGKVSKTEFDTLKSKVDDAFTGAIQSLQSSRAGSASDSSSSASNNSSSSQSQDIANLAALLDRVLKQYSAASAASLQRGSGSLLTTSA